MTEAQELYNQVLFGLRKQGVAAVFKAEDKAYASCKYRTEDGRKCAAGICIPDEEYDPAIEGDSIYGLLADREHLLPPQIRRNADLMGQLQRAHDSYMPRREDECDSPSMKDLLTMEAWERQMKNVATRFGLEYTPA